MPTTDTLTKQPDTTRPDPTTATSHAGSPGNSQTQGPKIDDAHGSGKATSSARGGVAFAIAAAVGVGALVFAVVAGPSDSTEPTGAYDRVEQNRTNTLRDLTTQPTSAHDQVEQNRTNTLRDLTTQPTE